MWYLEKSPFWLHSVRNLKKCPKMLKKGQNRGLLNFKFAMRASLVFDDTSFLISWKYAENDRICGNSQKVLVWSIRTVEISEFRGVSWLGSWDHSTHTHTPYRKWIHIGPKLINIFKLLFFYRSENRRVVSKI